MSAEEIEIHGRLVELIQLTESLIDEVKEFKELYKENHNPITETEEGGN